MLIFLILTSTGQILDSLFYTRKKYEEIAQDRIANLGPYLHKTYKDVILPSLSKEIQESIHDCTLDEETGRPLTKLDRELYDILQSGEELDYVDISLIT